MSWSSKATEKNIIFVEDSSLVKWLRFVFSEESVVEQSTQMVTPEISLFCFSFFFFFYIILETYFFCNRSYYITVPLHPIYLIVCVCVCSLGLQYRTSRGSAGLLWNSAEGLDGGWVRYTRIYLLLWKHCHGRLPIHQAICLEVCYAERMSNITTKEKEVEKSIKGRLRPCKEDTLSCYF